MKQSIKLMLCTLIFSLVNQAHAGITLCFNAKVKPAAAYPELVNAVTPIGYNGNYSINWYPKSVPGLSDQSGLMVIPGTLTVERALNGLTGRDTNGTYCVVGSYSDYPYTFLAHTIVKKN